MQAGQPPAPLLPHSTLSPLLASFLSPARLLSCGAVSCRKLLLLRECWSPTSHQSPPPSPPRQSYFCAGAGRRLGGRARGTSVVTTIAALPRPHTAHPAPPPAGARPHPGAGPISGAPLCSAISRDEPSSGELICISCLPGLGRGIFSRHDLPQNSQTSHQVETDDISIDEIIKSHHFTILITDDHFKNLSLCWTFSTGYSLPQPAAGAVSAPIWGTGE